MKLLLLYPFVTIPLPEFFLREVLVFILDIYLMLFKVAAEKSLFEHPCDVPSESILNFLGFVNYVYQTGMLSGLQFPIYQRKKNTPCYGTQKNYCSNKGVLKSRSSSLLKPLSRSSFLICV